jgi:tetratricopeptide (TPR) repeat protein
MYAQYIFYAFLFLVSFAAGGGILNENIYIKQFAFGAVFVAMILISVVRPSDKRTCMRVTWGDVFVLTLLFVYTFFYLGTHNMQDFMLPFVYFLFYGFIRIQADEPEETIQVWSRIVPVVMLLHILCSMLQFFHILPAFHGYFSAGSTFGNPDILGAYLAVLLPFCYINKEWRIFKIAVLCLTVILLFLLQARTALVAVAVPGVLFLLISGRLLKKHFFRWIPLIVIAGMILLIWWHPDSVSGRLFIWLISLNMLLSHPWGWGLYAFEKQYPEFQAEFVAEHDIPGFFHPDIVHSPYNEILNIGVTLGIEGLLPYMAFITFIVIAAYKRHSPLLYPFCSFLIVSLAYFPLKIVPLVIISIALSALIMTHCPINSLKSICFKRKKWILIPAMVITAWLTWNNYYNYRQWQAACKESVAGNLCDSDAGFSRLYASMRGNGRFLITWAKLKYEMGDSLQSLRLMQEAEPFFCDNLFLENLALSYENNGQIEQARFYFDKAVNIAPGQFKTAYERILFLQRTGANEEAYREAIKLYHQPVHSVYYADPFIIKAKLKTFIQSYSKQKSCQNQESFEDESKYIPVLINQMDVESINKTQSKQDSLSEQRNPKDLLPP